MTENAPTWLTTPQQAGVSASTADNSYVKKIFLYMGQGEWSLLGFFFFSKRESGNDARILKREKVMLASAFACSVASLTGVLVRVLCASDPDSC